MTMIEMASLPLERVLGAEVGQIYLDLHRDHGVEFLPETTVERFEGEGSVERVVTSDGALIETDFVVVGIGVAPRTGLLETAGSRDQRRPRRRRAPRVERPGVFAAGDVANAWHPFYRRSIRVEHWANALNQGPSPPGRCWARTQSTTRSPTSSPISTTLEWSTAATPPSGTRSSSEAIAAREFIAFWLKDERVVAGMNMNVWDVSDPIRELIRMRRPVDRRALTNPDIPLSQLTADAADEAARSGFEMYFLTSSKSGPNA